MIHPSTLCRIYSHDFKKCAVWSSLILEMSWDCFTRLIPCQQPSTKTRESFSDIEKPLACNLTSIFNGGGREREGYGTISGQFSSTTQKRGKIFL